MSAQPAVRNTGAVPRRPQTSDPDAWAAWRIAYERERHGWTQTELARLVTNAGAPIRQQTVWEIENREPPRRISLSEAMAFRQVFDLDSVEELGRPPEEIANDVVNEIKHLRRTLSGDANNLIEQLRYIREAAQAEPDIWRESVEDLRYQIAHVEQAIADIKAALAIESANLED